MNAVASFRLQGKPAPDLKTGTVDWQPKQFQKSITANL
jgi:hypothetical protein